MIQTNRDPARTGFLIGFIVGAMLCHVVWTVSIGTPEPDIHDLRAAGVYEYCWRVDAYRQDAGQPVRRGHDDFRGIYDEVCK